MRANKFRLLERLPETVSVPATSEFLVTEELLRDSKKYNIGWFGPNFRRLFFGKPCRATKSARTAFHILQKASLDPPIMAELKDSRMELGHMLWFVAQQLNGCKGPLRLNYEPNVGYINVEVQPGKTEPWAVDFHWRSDVGYWGVGAYPVDGENRWFEGRRFLSSELL